MLAVNHGQRIYRFNPRVLAGGRDSHNGINIRLISVSIHASSREDATRASRSYNFWICFNPRVLAGGRDWLILVSRLCLMFQSTRPRGRTRHGNRAYYLLKYVSIHASSREDATPKSTESEQQKRFQSTRPRGRTRPRVERTIFAAMVSIHASSREDATRYSGRWRRASGVSIHASSREDATARYI